MLFLWLIFILIDFGRQVALVVICWQASFYKCLRCMFMFAVDCSSFYSFSELLRQPNFILVSFGHQVAVGNLWKQLKVIGQMSLHAI